ncbi:MAG: regulatory protein RecX [Alphaproteobacteria bacterium]|nr:MAG: regulatory protein RecX [Alphaproteobacteria bacterium]
MHTMEKQPAKFKPLKPILDYTLAILAKREHSSTEVRRKLATKGYPKADVAQTIQQMVEKNYINDTRYAAARARTRAQNSKWGQGRIKQELSQNGIDKSTTTTTLDELSENHDWLATATRLLKARFPKPLPSLNDLDSGLNRQDVLKDLQKEKARRLNFLLRRGFTMGQSLQALGLSQEDVTDNDFTDTD